MYTRTFTSKKKKTTDDGVTDDDTIRCQRIYYRSRIPHLISEESGFDNFNLVVRMTGSRIVIHHLYFFLGSKKCCKRNFNVAVEK